MPDFTIELKGKSLSFHTNDKVFSPSGLDRGTAAMLSFVDFAPDDRVLDLGCGYGAVGILAAACLSPGQVTMCDISEDAIQLSIENARKNGVLDGLAILRSDGLSDIQNRNFTKILSNPPYHTDFSVARAFIEEGWRHLAPGGVMYMVTKRREWYKNKLIAVFGGVHIEEADGYFVFSAMKKDRKQKRDPASKQNPHSSHLSKKLARKQRRGSHPS